MTEILRKFFEFKVFETKEIERKGQKYGIINGYASTYNNIDRGNDRILKNAFTKSLKRYSKNNRPIKMHYQHSGMDIIGGFPIEDVREDEKGLFMKGEINLEVQRGREAYALAKQGVLSDLSIGYSINDFEYKNIDNQSIRELKELELWEVSIVGEPMNDKAVITEVKSTSKFENFPLASRDVEWNADEAIKRLREFTNSNEEPSESYKLGFFWYDKNKENNFTSYKLPFVDVIDGKLTAIPRAIFAVTSVLKGGRGGVNIPEMDRPKVIEHINNYYNKMNLDSPFIIKSSDSFGNLFKKMGDIEHYFKYPYPLSTSERKCIIYKIKEFSKPRDVDLVQDRDVLVKNNEILSKLDSLIKFTKEINNEQYTD